MGDHASKPTVVTRRRLMLGGGAMAMAVGAAVVGCRASNGEEPGPTVAPTHPSSADTPSPTSSTSASAETGASSPPGLILQATSFAGIYYGQPTITLTGSSNAWNQSQLGLPIGATRWRVLDSRGSQVGQGGMSPDDTEITVARNGSWIGGSAIEPGYYTVATDPGSKGVAVGTALVCPPTALHVPKTVPALAAWLGVAPDRAYYAFAPGNTKDIVGTRRIDPYFTDRQDPDRPRAMWIAPSPQSPAPHQSPSPQEWAELAAGLRAAGYPGAWYECPTNEPENGGWKLTELVAYWNACRDAIHAADPKAHVMGFDSAGIMAASSIEDLGRFLAHCRVDAITNHMENSHQNLSNIVALRQLFGALKGEFAKAGRPHLDLWLTETGINGGGYGVLQPRRDARQRTVLRLIFESYGWAKEHSFDFPVSDAHGSGLATFMFDGQNSESTGNLRAGAYALHVMSEALRGTTCTPTSPPKSLRLGNEGGVGDSLFAGLHYDGSKRDVVVLASNGMERASVDLKVSTSGTVTVWDGMGVESTVPVTAGRVQIPLDDLVTYVFLPPGTSVEALPAWWSSLTDCIHGKELSSSAPGRTEVLTGGTFSANLQGGTVPVPHQPYITKQLPVTFSVTTDRAAKGFVLFTGGPAWQTAGCSLVAFDIKVDGQQVYSYKCQSASTLPIPSPSSANSSDVCLYTTFWTGPFAWLEKVDIPAGKVELTITQVSFGGQPDALGSKAPGSRSVENDGQELHLVAWQLLA